MRTIGIIGGMSWESSLEYYRILNREVRSRLGGHHSARVLMLSVDFAPIVALQHEGDWTALGDEMAAAAQALERGGAGCVLIATNTMHLLADRVAAAVAIPLLHIGDAAGRAVAAAGHRRVGLLGTAFTMEQPFYADRLARHGLDVLIPDADDRATVHRIIYDELVGGRIEPSSRQAYRAVIARLVDRGAEAIVLGCTEIMLLVDDTDSAVPLFDTTRLHALAAIDWAL
ncbi:aspartate/glutamate racemase family protein [Sphingomonas sp. 1P08PE]|uniref:aspartate/glutamate racemase family protein n=1 Tax=Sphingomonas sp. 1P08PE TaxID=554122 RepID=UPI0039A33106